MTTPFYIRTALGFILFIQVFFALVIGPILAKNDVFPLHQWALFGKVFRTETMPVIYVTQINSEALNPPQNYYDLIPQRGPIDFLVGRDNLLTWLKLIQEQKQIEADEMRRSIENHLWPHVARLHYEIRIVKVDLVEFATKRKIIEVVNTYGPFYKENKNQ